MRASIPANIELNLSIVTGESGVIASPVEIQQIIMNLVTNAYLSMPEHGGAIDITISEIDLDPGLTIFDGALSEYIQIVVEDTGTGMSPDVMHRIFEPFYTTRKPGKGTGMGLAVIYGIVKDLKGTISVESEVGSGSTFRVFLPKAMADESKPRITQTPIIGGNEKILYIDDEPLLVELGKIALEKLGYAVTGVMDGNKALKMFSEDPMNYDLVITDHAMPSITGKQVAEQILKIRPDIPIILCTGHSETFSAPMAKKMGIKKYLEKLDTRYHKEATETSNSGFTLSFSNPILNTIAPFADNKTSPLSRANEVSDPRLKALYAVKAGKQIFSGVVPSSRAIR